MNHADDLVSRLQNRRVAVIGDVILDHFVIGRVDRISPEAPVPVVRFAREEFRLGGAANVARNIAALGGRAMLVGLVGRDAASDGLRQELDTVALDGSGLIEDDTRPTTRKVRLVTARNQQVARIDYEADGDVSTKSREALLAKTEAVVRDCDAVIISDYSKGVIDLAVMAAAAEGARAAGAPLVADPKGPQAERYRDATLITPNHHEAELMTQAPIRDASDARRAAHILHDRTGASVVITWGEHGMWILDRADGAVVEAHLPAVSREVADVTGAGDTVVAVLALGLAAGSPLLDAARLANRAAGVVVGRFGPAAVTPAELGHQDPTSDR
jgi:D-beta-D-heptose 7-phosphate kinase/D-beta-D-heptose 1-phosphate adenosyltransferase